jgi:3-dehydroquinate synthase
MAQAAKCSEYMAYADRADTDKIMGLLESLRLPVELPNFGAAAYREALLRDKKVRDCGINFVFNRGIGDHQIARMEDIPLLLKICGIGD